jgi:peptidyl-prolyl cis-trans isomerase SurA
MPIATFRFCAVLGVLAATSFGVACGPKAPAPPPPVSADTWAVVDGHNITRDDVEKAYRRAGDPAPGLSDEEVLTTKLGLLDNLILQEILLAQARALNLTVPDTEVDTAFNDAKKNIAEDVFQEELKKRGLSAAEMKEGLRRDLLTNKVVEHEVVSKIAVSDKDVTDFFNANRSQFNVPEESYHIAQIVITPSRDTQVTNTTGDDAATPQAAAAKVQMLMERLKAGASFRDLAIGYSEDPESAPRGGDLGLVPVSRLKQAPPQLRDAVLSKTPGSVNVASSEGAHTLVLVVSHEQPGQRDLSMGTVRQDITQALKSRKEQLLRAAYLSALRTDAKVVNHEAHRVVDAKGAVPGVSPAAGPAK